MIELVGVDYTCAQTVALSELVGPNLLGRVVSLVLDRPVLFPLVMEADVSTAS